MNFALHYPHPLKPGLRPLLPPAAGSLAEGGLGGEAGVLGRLAVQQFLDG